jgi:hypothetical protein
MSAISANAAGCNLRDRSNVLLAHLSQSMLPALAGLSWTHGSGRGVSLRITNDAGVQGCRVFC